MNVGGNETAAQSCDRFCVDTKLIILATKDLQYACMSK